jgi:hypothetical protein
MNRGHFDIESTLLNCNVRLDLLTDKIIQNQNQLDLGSIDQWKDTILALSQENCKLLQYEKEVGKIINDIRNDHINLPNQSFDDCMQYVENMLNARVQNLDGTSIDTFKTLKRKLEPKSLSEDEELVIQENSMTEADIKCPVTSKIFVRPLKRYVPLLQHRFSVTLITVSCVFIISLKKAFSFSSNRPLPVNAQLVVVLRNGRKQPLLSIRSLS